MGLFEPVLLSHLSPPLACHSTSPQTPRTLAAPLHSSRPLPSFAAINAYHLSTLVASSTAVAHYYCGTSRPLFALDHHAKDARGHCDAQALGGWAQGWRCRFGGAECGVQEREWQGGEMPASSRGLRTVGSIWIVCCGHSGLRVLVRWLQEAAWEVGHSSQVRAADFLMYLGGKVYGSGSIPGSN